MTLGSTRRFIIGGAAIGLILIASLFVRGQTKRRHDSDRETAGNARIASVATARLTPLARTIVLSGEFKPFQEVDLHAKVAGYIRRIFVDVGDKVRAGQTIAILEVPELDAAVEEAHASQERAKSTYAAAHAAYDRLKQASDQRPGLIAAQELDDALARDQEAGAQVAAAEAKGRQVSAQADFSRITAPFSGVITQRFADTGSLIQAGTSSNTQAMPVVQVAEFDRLRLVIPVPESAVSSVHLGTNVDVKVPALGRVFRGEVARFADSLDRQTRTMETEIDVPNTNDSLVAGMYAEVVLDLQRKSSVLTVPVQAVSQNGTSATCLVIGAGNRVEERTVRLGMEGEERVEVVSGLRQGELVLIGSRADFRSGDEVHPRPVSEKGE